jgi:hypothetical protein
VRPLFSARHLDSALRRVLALAFHLDERPNAGIGHQREQKKRRGNRVIKAGLNAAANWLADHPCGFLAVFTLMLMWPVLLNGGPFYFGDSPGYLKGAEVALNFAAERLHAIFGEPSEGGAVAVAAGGGVWGVRSVVYSVFAYLTCAPGDSWLFTCLFQALAVAFALGALFQLCGLAQTPMALLAFAGLAAFATPASWFAVLATPDVFAGVAILAIGLLTAFPERLSLITRIVFAALIAFAVCAHLSHVPIIGSLAALSGLVLLTRYGLAGWRRLAARYAWVALPAIAGLAVIVVINAIGFKEVSVSGKRYPIVLASSIQAGPARWYLETHCATEHYTVCELYVTFPHTSQEFLWGKQGVRKRATIDQMERIRREEPIILKRVIAAYPFSTVKEAAIASLSQLFAIGLDDHHFGFRLKRDADGVVQLIETEHSRSFFKTAIKCGFLLVMSATLGLLVWLIKKRGERLDAGARTLLFMVVCGCVINAIVCGALSAVTDRYQGRVVWVAILCIAVIAWVRTRPATAPTKV